MSPPTVRDKKCLMIAYFFPPLGGIGSLRTLKFCKYLPHYGWLPYILTTQRGLKYPQDATLLEQVPAEVQVFRAPCIDPARIEALLLLQWKLLWKVRLRRLAMAVEPYKVMRWLAFPDPMFTWLGPAFAKGLHVMLKYQVPVVYTTAPPFTSHLVGYLLKIATGALWVADFRDPWSRNPFTVYPIGALRALNTYLERKTLQRADGVITVHKRCLQRLDCDTASHQEDKIDIIPNGYDPEDFQDAPSGPLKERFTLAYVGSLYGLRTARYLLTAMNTLVQQGQIPEDKVHVILQGTMGDPSVREFYNCSWLEVREPVSHREAILTMRAADVLLLLVTGGEEVNYCVTGKVFEYMATGRPILAMAPPTGAAAQLVLGSGTGVVVPAEDVGEISRTLLELYKRWEAGNLTFQRNEDFVRQFDRRSLTAKLAILLDRLIGQDNRPGFSGQNDGPTVICS
ncbi:MAG: glycosyltransferase [Candidatus Methanomethyliaceae archaeon]